VDTEILCVFTSEVGEKVPANKDESRRNQPNTRHSNTLIEISCSIEHRSTSLRECSEFEHNRESPIERAVMLLVSSSSSDILNT
jgi:hypothetical protein